MVIRTRQLIYIMQILFISHICLGETKAKKAPLDWGRTTINSASLQKQSKIKAIMKIAFLNTDDQETYQLKNLKAMDQNRSNFYIGVCSGDDFAMSNLVNRNLVEISDDKDLENVAKQARTSCDAESFLVQYKNTWTLYTFQGDELVKVVETARPSRNVKWQTLVNWFRKKLGYDGVVIAKEENRILVGTFRKLIGKEMQALVLEQSSQKIKLPLSVKKRKGAAILRYTADEGSFVVFEVLLGSQNIEVGSKVVLAK